MRGNWNYPTSIRFGAGRLQELPEACRELGIERPLLVTDPGLVALPPVIKARELCPRAHLFADVQANPTEENVMAGVAAFRAGDCDGVIALGGGSSLDAGKAIALMVGQDRPLFDFEDVGHNWTRVRTEGLAPVVAVPTTAGTGSEVGRVSVITDAKAHVKRLIFHPRVVPGKVIADPETTYGLPAKLTAATGMDALAHALEALCAPGFHPMADGIATEALHMIRRSLPVAVRSPQDAAARAEMLAASLMGATAFQKGLGAVHSLSHPLGALTGAHHGLLNGILMPYVLDFNRPAIEEPLQRLGGFAAVRQWLVELRAEIGIPATLEGILSEEQIEQVATEGMNDPSVGTNPVPLTVAAHRQILEAALARVSTRPS